MHPRRLLLARTEEVLPFVYTPTVGEACQRYHELKQRRGLHTRGLYLSLQDRHHLLERLQAWPQHQVRLSLLRILCSTRPGTHGRQRRQPPEPLAPPQVRVVVVTDGERILGLGDLGTGGESGRQRPSASPIGTWVAANHALCCRVPPPPRRHGHQRGQDHALHRGGR